MFSHFFPKIINTSEEEFQFNKEMIASSYKFAFSLFKILAKEDESCFFSPFSIYVALCLMYVGAKDETAKEIEKYLHLPPDKDKFLHSLRLFLNQLKTSKLNIVTKIFIEKSYNLKGEYKDTIKKYFDSKSKLLDLKKNNANAEKCINSWVSTKTGKKIQNIIPAGTLNKDTRLVLISAIHFKDNWLLKFDKKYTYDDVFYLNKEKSIKIPMMRITNHFNFIQKDSYKVLELLYENKDFKMIIILPNEIEGLCKLHEDITHLNIDEIIQDLRLEKVIITLLKFKLEKYTDFNHALQILGIKTMFTHEADFSDLYDSNQEHLFVNKILHKAVIEVNEKGTEAAVSTTVSTVVPVCLRIMYEFKADHPFRFYIFYKGAILFAGKYVPIPDE
ncbi:hypothetical protein PGB90_000949 [Kerria lacca]